jgi:hypothetical protein
MIRRTVARKVLGTNELPTRVVFFMARPKIWNLNVSRLKPPLPIANQMLQCPAMQLDQNGRDENVADCSDGTRLRIIPA